MPENASGQGIRSLNMKIRYMPQSNISSKAQSEGRQRASMSAAGPLSQDQT